jgi:hypothetical protein
LGYHQFAASLSAQEMHDPARQDLLASSACEEREDDDLLEEKIMRQVLSVRESSICLCSTAIVAHALAPWNFEAIKEREGNADFAKLNMYAIAWSSMACSFCAHWVPF